MNVGLVRQEAQEDPARIRGANLLCLLHVAQANRKTLAYLIPLYEHLLVGQKVLHELNRPREWSGRRDLARTSSAMYNLIYSNITFYSCEKESFLAYYRHNNKRRFSYLSHALAKNCRSLIVVVSGPSVDYEENPTQDYEHDRKKTWNMLRILTDPRYTNKIIELTFARVDLLPSNIFAQSNMADFQTLHLLRIIDCREFGHIDVALNDWSFIAERGIGVQYSWKYAKIPRTHGNDAGAILSRMFKWRLEKADAGKKAI